MIIDGRLVAVAKESASKVLLIGGQEVQTGEFMRLLASELPEKAGALAGIMMQQSLVAE